MEDETKITEGWIDTRIGDISDVKGGKRMPKGSVLTTETTNHPYIRITDFEGNSINKNNLLFVPENVFEKISRYIVNSGDVIISIVGTIGLIGKIVKDLDNASLTENCVKLVNLRNVFPNYLYYYLSSKKGQNEISKNTVGAVQKKLPIYGVQNIKIILPPLQEQKAITKVLSAFDNKIELLQAQNKTLETMAQTIFKEWFGKYQIGDELPEGWRLCELGDIVSKSNTGADAIKKAPIVAEDTGFRCLRIGDLSNNRSFDDWGFTSVTEKNFKQFQLKKYDIVITRTSILGLNKLIMEDLNAVYNNGLIKISLVENVNPFFIFSYFKSKRYRNYISMINNDTSTRPNMKIDYLLRFPIILPTRDLEVKFSKFMGSVMLKISKNKNQIQSLKKTRDTLLPKLMSGQVRVKNIKHTADA
jgi:type I restriction enzyme, S subunit